jgi:MraZ protein
MFLGQYRHALDAKGRLTIPARFRDMLADGAFITQGFDRNLRLVTEPTFEVTYDKVNKLSMTDPRARQLRRLIFASASRVELDRVGRVLIPQFLREIAGLTSDAIIVGVGETVEIWSPEAWEAQIALLSDVEANAQQYAELDLSI